MAERAPGPKGASSARREYASGSPASSLAQKCSSHLQTSPPLSELLASSPLPLPLSETPPSHTRAAHARVLLITLHRGKPDLPVCRGREVTSFPPPSAGESAEWEARTDAMVVRRLYAGSPRRVAGLADERDLPPRGAARVGSVGGPQHHLVPALADGAERAVRVDQVKRVEPAVHGLPRAHEVGHRLPRQHRHQGHQGGAGQGTTRPRRPSGGGGRGGRMWRSPRRGPDAVEGDPRGEHGQDRGRQRGAQRVVVEAPERGHDGEPVQEGQVPARNQRQLEADLEGSMRGESGSCPAAKVPAHPGKRRDGRDVHERRGHRRRRGRAGPRGEGMGPGARPRG